jgi:hypothetical protein
MKLYEAPHQCWIRPISDIKTPIASPEIKVDEPIWFDHIDGMYSYCKNLEGEIVFLVAWAEVYVDEDMVDIPVPKRKGV